MQRARASERAQRASRATPTADSVGLAQPRMRLRDLLPQGQYHLHVGIAECAKHLRTQCVQADLDLANQRLACIGEPQLVGAAVAAVGLAAQQALRGQLVQQAHQRGAFHAQLLGQRHLTDAAAGAPDHQQWPGAGAGQVELGERLVGQALPLTGGHQQAGTELGAWRKSGFHNR
ncbi:hypothetical protein XAC2852_900014 [Xanthomonas citri pv. citri]|nr:hypothetical protein XAC2852_900014 [Xanthomonas citri pv. citri]